MVRKLSAYRRRPATVDLSRERERASRQSEWELYRATVALEIVFTNTKGTSHNLLKIKFDERVISLFETRLFCGLVVRY